MPKLIVLSGYSGSGKSTLAEQLRKQGCYALVRSDDYYHCYGPGMDVTDLLIDVAVAFGRKGISVIVDAVNKHPVDRLRWDAAGKIFREYRWMELDVPIEECIRRDALRPRPVGANAILSQLA